MHMTCFCARCNKTQEAPTGPLPEGWVLPEKPVEHKMTGAMPPYTVLAFCSDKCMNAQIHANEATG